MKASELLSLRSVFVLAFLLFLLFALLVLPAMSARTASYTPAGSGFDTDFFYSPGEVPGKVAAYTDEGRRAYLFDRWTFDLVFPLVYGFFMLSAWAFGLRVLFGVPSPLGRLHGMDGSRVPAQSTAELQKRWPVFLLWIPAGGIVLDFLENSLVSLLMLAWPSVSGTLALGSSLASAGKWLFVGIGFAGALLLPAMAVLKAAVGRLRKP